MDILEKTLSEKTEAVYREITKRLVYPVTSSWTADWKIPFLRTRWSET